MGSFTEVVLSFEFKETTPDHVLAAFSRLAVPQEREGAPQPPAPVTEQWDMFSPDWRESGGERDPFEHEPWRHDWAEWVSLSMGASTTPHGRMTWSDLSRWHLDCRFAWKTFPESVSETLAWLAPYVEPHWRTRPLLVGHAMHEAAPRPHLFWVDQGSWVLEDLNPDDEWTWG